MKCKTCKTSILKNWEYCPKCGSKLTKKSVFPIAKISYMWEKKDGGSFIYKNFGFVRESGLFSYKKTVHRPTLGDFVHINFYNLRKFGLLLYNPELIYELYEACKLMGYYDTENFIIEAKLQKLRESLSRTDNFWSIFKDKKFIESGKKAYSKNGIGILDWTFNEQDGRGTYEVKESVSTPVKSSHSCCPENISDFIGALESFSYRFWNGRESKCRSKGDEYCQFDMYITKTEKKPNINVLDKTEVDNILEKIIYDLNREKVPVYRKTIGDYMHIGGDQCINYILISRSLGHHMLSKYSGNIVGQKIIQERGLTTKEETLKHLGRIFKYLKAGIIEPQYSDTIKVKMHESVYSSGVNNINMKLDTFIAGIIEGALNEATNQKWLVEETKCLANGDKHCEFTCKPTK